MKVTATHWVNHNGHWYRPGEAYDDGTETRAEVPENEETSPDAEKAVAPKRTRRKADKGE